MWKQIASVKHVSRQVSPFHRPRRRLGRVEVQLYSILDLCTRRGEGSASRLGSILPPGKTRYPLYRRLVGPQGRSGQVRKISPHRHSIPGPFSPQVVAIPTTLPGPLKHACNVTNKNQAYQQKCTRLNTILTESTLCTKFWMSEIYFQLRLTFRNRHISHEYV